MDVVSEFMNLIRKITIFKKIKSLIFHRAVVITALSALTFILPTLLDVYFVRNRFELSYENRQFATIGFSLLVIFLNLLIIRKWLSLKQVGLQKSGFIKSLVYSLIFVFLLRIFDYFGYREIFPKTIWDKQFILHLSTFVFLAFQEELMFRGIIFKVWNRWKGFLIALFVSSTLFGLEHLVYPALGFEQVTMSRALTTALFGPAFVLVAYRAKNIWGLTISHFLYNASLLIAEPLVGDITPKDSFILFSVGVSIFLPIGIDFVDRRISKLKLSDIRWSLYLATLFSIFFILFTSIFVLEDLGITDDSKEICPYIENEKVKSCLAENEERVDGCYGIDLRLEKAREDTGNSQKGLELLQENCLWLFDAQTHDFTGDGEEELAMITAGAGCASCHWNRIYIIKGDQVIFEKNTQDVFFWPAEDYPGFIIKYPLRRQGEGYCCPSEGIVESYTVSELDDSYQTFYKFDERSEPYTD